VFNNMYWAWDGVLPNSFCDYVLESLDWSKAIDGRVRDGDGLLDTDKRITKVLWAEMVDPISAVAFHYTTMANELAGWNFDIRYPQQVQLGRYSEGGHYDWHHDCQNPDSKDFQRKLSCSIILNDSSEYDGGDLEIRYVFKHPPKSKGSVIVFPSIVEHRVTPVTRGERFSAVCWTIGPAFK
jgi:predicted 2-oxoglutarate/Fe(II)-dependent dioxygenase YbiX